MSDGVGRPVADWLQGLLDEHDSPPRNQPEQRGFRRRPGEIARLDPMDMNGTPSVLCYVVDSDDVLGMVSLVALSADIEMRSEVDCLLPSQLTGLGYDVIALTDVIGYAWFSQLGRTLGFTHPDHLPSLPVGLPVRGEADCRWAWKENMLALTNALTSECSYELLESTEAPLVDPAALSTTESLGVQRTASAALKIKELVQKRVGRLDMRTFLAPSMRGRVSGETVAVLMDVMARHSHKTMTASEGGGPKVRHLSGRETKRSDPLFDMLSDEVDRGHRCIRVLSQPEFWESTTTNEPVLGVYCGFAGPKRYQVVALSLEAQEA